MTTTKQDGVVRRSTGEQVLRAERVSLHFGGIRALQALDVTLHRGEWCGLIGPNGSGKTSSLNVLSGFYRPQTGSVVYGETDVAGVRPNDRRRRGIVRTFQHPVLSGRLSLLDNVVLAVPRSGRGAAARHAADEIARASLAAMDCLDLCDSPAGSVAFGVQKRAEIARAIASDPQILLLDEPAAGLSPEERAEVLDSLRRYRAEHPDLAAVVVEHDVQFVAALCESAVALDFGEVVTSGSVADVLADPRVRSAFLGEQVEA